MGKKADTFSIVVMDDSENRYEYKLITSWEITESGILNIYVGSNLIATFNSSHWVSCTKLKYSVNEGDKKCTKY